MLVLMRPEAGERQLAAVEELARELGFYVRRCGRAGQLAVAVSGGTVAPQATRFLALDGVLEVERSDNRGLLAWHSGEQTDTAPVEVAGLSIGGPELVVMAGPCAIEDADRLMAGAELVKKAGARMLRGGAYKPRTSPYAFQGLGRRGLELLAEVRRATGLAIVTEAVDQESLEAVAEVADLIQIGARNMKSYAFLRHVGRAGRPVLLKRGMDATLEEWLLSAEYLLSEGAPGVVLCERGIRTFVDHTRNTLDLSVVPAVKQVSPLPVIVDPSHGCGVSELVPPMARAAVAAGADGLLIEVHPEREHALSDAHQALTPEAFSALMAELATVASAVGRRL